MEVLELIERGEHQVSPSRLKNLKGDTPRNYLSNNIKQSDEVRLGLIVESLFFENKKNYTVLNKVNDICRECGDYLYKNNYPAHDVYLLKYADKFKYCTQMKPLTRIKRLRDSNVEQYLTELNTGLILIDLETEEKAKALVKGLKNSPQITQLFNKEGEYQKRIDFKYKGVDCKGFLDYFSDRVIDLKVVSQSWRKSAKMFDWGLQGAFYQLGVQADKLPLFIVADVNNPDNPFIVEMSQKDYELAISGYTVEKTLKLDNDEELISSYRVEGVSDLIDRYKFHSSTGLWDFPKEYYDNDEKFSLNLNL